MGSIIDWYTATLFRREPAFSFEGTNENARQFFNTFTEDCDLKGTNLTEFFRARFIQALILGKSHILVDFPRRAPAGNRAEEDLQGTSRAYLVGYSADDLINWSYDEYGNYEWVVLRTSGLRKPNIEDANWLRETRWAYYDRENYKLYERTGEHEGQGEVRMTASGRHGLARNQRVPLFDLEVMERCV